MFKIGDRVNCVCDGLVEPPDTVGIVREGPHNSFGRNIYKVFFPGNGILVISEDCLQLSASAHLASLKSVKVISKNTKVKKESKGVIASDPQMLFGKVMFDVIFEGQSSTIRLAESSLASDTTD